ncbi:PfkB family carbohydrate kinase [Candidatus Albibeggiatoa sp. nov. NOAA]|uniref:PfkB family carbohydrate kinase n=1 Tax=Candidatus Albibeggiatoa sp. nov. NOAA TaxID=3162724 RepID=UPI003300348B|nr:PfkB family carbohydrate kinase [Thiotrichaceae bacterium]
MSQILAVGIATLDVINIVDEYPKEDTEMRVAGQRICRGGNATNTLVVLSQLQHQCSWAGVWVDEPDGRTILADLQRHQINTDYCQVEKQGKVPTSYILLSQQTGSRTIVHHRNIPELSFQQFQKVDLSRFDWVHFEGRNVIETYHMLQWVKQQQPDLPISLEIEKPRLGIERLFQYADLLLCSQSFAHHHAYYNAADFLRDLRQQVTDTELVCAWGHLGAYAMDMKGQILHSPAYPPPQVVDTLGAGDTFNASLIDSFCRQQDLSMALHEACWLAGKKCGQVGLEPLSRAKP